MAAKLPLSVLDAGLSFFNPKPPFLGKDQGIDKQYPMSRDSDSLFLLLFQTTVFDRFLKP